MRNMWSDPQSHADDETVMPKSEWQSWLAMAQSNKRRAPVRFRGHSSIEIAIVLAFKSGWSVAEISTRAVIYNHEVEYAIRRWVR